VRRKTRRLFLGAAKLGPWGDEPAASGAQRGRGATNRHRAYSGASRGHRRLRWALRGFGAKVGNPNGWRGFLHGGEPPPLFGCLRSLGRVLSRPRSVHRASTLFRPRNRNPQFRPIPLSSCTYVYYVYTFIQNVKGGRINRGFRLFEARFSP
jgi:hypothetical protein